MSHSVVCDEIRMPPNVLEYFQPYAWVITLLIFMACLFMPVISCCMNFNIIKFHRTASVYIASLQTKQFSLYRIILHNKIFCSEYGLPMYKFRRNSIFIEIWPAWCYELINYHLLRHLLLQSSYEPAYSICAASSQILLFFWNVYLAKFSTAFSFFEKIVYCRLLFYRPASIRRRTICTGKPEIKHNKFHFFRPAVLSLFCS